MVGGGSVLTVRAAMAEVLSLDWSKYDEHVFATAAVDKTVCTWDLRNPSAPVQRLAAHTYAVRRVRFSPHEPTLLLSSSYDMGVCLWDAAQPQPLLRRRARLGGRSVGSRRLSADLI